MQEGDNKELKEVMTQEPTSRDYMSNEIGKLAIALAKFKAQCPDIKLDKNVKVKMNNGGHYFFSYATLSSIHQSTKQPLSDNGLSVSQVIIGSDKLVTILMHESGQYIISEMDIYGVKSVKNIQEYGGCVTYCKRYALCAILGVSGDADDDDGNGASGNKVEPQKQTKAPAQSKSNPQLTPESEKWADAVNYVKEGSAKGPVTNFYTITKKHLEQLNKEAEEQTV